MTHITDWSQLGIFPLQDHDDEVEVDMRFALVGGRVKGKDDATGLAVLAKDQGLGTAGTVHPWRYFPPVSRGKRPMGSWSMAMPGVATSDASGGGMGGGTGYTRAGPSGISVQARPIRKDDYKPDTRFREITHKLPDGYDGVKEGDLVVLMAGTEEDEQEDLAFPLSPSVLIAPNVNGPSYKGTKVFDLAPGGAVSGIRWGRLQSVLRVVMMPDTLKGVHKKPGNALALQYTASGQGDLVGYGAIYGQVEGSESGGGTEKPTTDTIGGALGGGTSYNGGTSTMRRNIPGSNPDPHHPNKWAGTGPGVQGPPGGG